MTLFRRAIICLVIVFVGAAFFFMGSPKTERMRQFDQQRVNDLQTIQWQIVNYWQQKEELPASLGMLEDDISGFRTPHDPETGIVYEYTMKGGMTFELCANFSLVSSDANTNKAVPYPVGEFGANWNHAAGRTCFSRTIDPELYPPQKGLDKIAPVPAVR